MTLVTLYFKKNQKDSETTKVAFAKQSQITASIALPETENHICTDQFIPLKIINEKTKVLVHYQKLTRYFDKNTPKWQCLLDPVNSDHFVRHNLKPLFSFLYQVLCWPKQTILTNFFTISFIGLFKQFVGHCHSRRE